MERKCPVKSPAAPLLAEVAVFVKVLILRALAFLGNAQDSEEIARFEEKAAARQKTAAKES